MIQQKLLIFFSIITFSFCYEYIDILPYQNKSFSLTRENPYIIYRFKNNPYQLNEGYIQIQLNLNSYSGIFIYVFTDFSNIKEETKGIFINYKKKIDSLKDGIFELNNVENGFYYFIISTPNYNYKDTIMFFNPSEYFKLPINYNIFFNYIKINTNRVFTSINFLIPKFSTYKYFIFLGEKSVYYFGSFTIKIKKGIDGESIYTYGASNDLRIKKIFKIEPNLEHAIEINYERPFPLDILKIAFYVSDYGLIESLDVYNCLQIPFFIKNINYYFYLKVDYYNLNEMIYFKYTNYYPKDDIKIYGKFYETNYMNEIEKDLPKHNIQYSVNTKYENEEHYGYIQKNDTNYKILVLSIEKYYHKGDFFKICKKSVFERITSNILQTYKYYIHKSLYIDELSFKTNSKYIILFSNEENIIHISNKITPFYYNSSKLYIISKKILSSLEKETLYFEVYKIGSNDFYFEIKYVNEFDIYYFNKLSRSEINNIEIRIDDCSKKTYLFSNFKEKIKKDIFLAKNLDKNIKIYKQDDKIINNINNLFTFDKIYGLITYPKLMETDYDLFEFTCKKPSIIRINYYKAEDSKNIINLNKGKSYQFYIKQYKTETYNIDFSFLKSNFYYKIMLFERNIPSNINFNFNGNQLILTNNNPIIKGEIQKMNYNIIKINSNVEILILLYIAAEKNLFESISFQSKNKYLESEYSLFLFSNLYKQKEFSNFYIKNNGNTNINICIHKGNDIISKIEKWIFLESNCFELTKNLKYHLYLDNPYLNGKDNEMNYISLYTKDYKSILYDYEYRDVIELKSYQNYNIKLNEKKYYQILKYFNNQSISEGELRILFNNNNKAQSINLFIYYDKTFIHETLNVFDNYIYQKTINNKISFSPKDNLYLPIGYWYIVIVSNLGNNFEDNFIIYNQGEYYILSEKKFYLKYYIHNNIDYAYFKIPPFSKYLTLHYEWYNNLNECLNSIIINNEEISDFKESISDNYEIKDKTKDNIIKINFKTSKIGVHSRLLLYLTENKKILYLTNDFKPIKIPILSHQIIYLFNDISRDDLNENIYFILNGNKILNPKIKFYNTDNLNSILYSLPKSLEQFDIEMNIYENDMYYYNKTNENNKYAIIGIQVPFSNLKEYSFQKIDLPRLIHKNVKKKFLKNETKDYYINEDSFINKDIKILLFAERDNIISFKEGFETKFYNKNNIYLISYDMLKTYSKIEFTISDPNKSKDYLFEIRYLKDEILYYYNTDSRFKLNNLYYEINDCSKHTNIIGLYENIESSSIFYINSIEGDAKIYYTNSINELDDIYNLSNEHLYKYPFIINSKKDFIKISCIIPSKIEIIYYNVQKEGIINLQKGVVVPFYIEKNQNLELKINPNSLLFGEYFYSKIKLIQNKYENNMSIEINFNNISSTLDNNNYYIENQHEKLKNPIISFKSGISNCFIFIYISLDKYSINYIKNEITNSKFTKFYNIFVFPLNLISNINSMANIYILNKENNISSICLNKNYGNIERIYKETSNCITLKKGENITISLIYENAKNIVNEEINYYLLAYTENIKDFEFTFNFYTYSNLISYHSFDFNIGKNNYIILCFENKKFDKFNEELIGEIIFKFGKGKVNGSNLYIYEDKKEIHKKDNNIFDNYISKIDINNDYLFTYNYPKNLKYYFVIQSNEKEFKDRIIIYNPIIPFEINEMNIFNKIYETDLISDSFLFYFNNSNNPNSTNLHYQWCNQQLNSNSKIIIFNSTFKYEQTNSYIQKSDYFTFYNNSEYYILIQEDNSLYKKRISLNILFYFSLEKQIFLLSERNIFRTFPIISNQLLYFYINIETIVKGEEEYIKIKKIKDLNIQYFVKFYKDDNLDKINLNDYENELILEECDENYCKYSFEKINDIDKSAILIVEINSNKNIYYTNFEILLIDDYKLLYKSFIKDFSKDNIGKYLINEKSFKAIQTIIIKSDREGIIHLNNTINSILLNEKKVYVFTKNDLKNSKEIYLTLSDENKDYNFTIEILTFDINYNIKYINTNSRKDSMNSIKIENCNNFNGLIGVYNNLEKMIFYVDIIKGDAQIYYKNSIKELNEFLNLNKSSNNLYTYPLIYDSKYDYIQIICTQPIEINIINYDISSNEIELTLGMSIPFFISKMNTSNYIIKDKLQILNNKIKYKFELILSKYYNKRVKYFFGENEYELNSKIPFIQKYEKIKGKHLSINSIEGDILLFLYIGIDNNDIKYYSNILKQEQLERKYSIFTYSNEQINSSNHSSIYITNKGMIKKKICYLYLYNNLEYIFPMNNNNNCFEMKENNNISIIFNNPLIEKNKDDEQYFYLIFVEDTLNLICDYTYIIYHEIYNNQLNIISFSSVEKYKILYFNYKNIGDILLKFDEKLDEGTKFYLYYNKEDIHFISDNFDGNIILNKNINNLNQFLFSVTQTNFYFIIFNDKGINNKKVTLIGTEIPYEIPINNKTYLKYYTSNEKQYSLNYIINKLSKNIYLNIQWIIEDSKSNSSIIIYTNNIKKPIYQCIQKNQNSTFILLEPNIEYKLLFNIFSDINDAKIDLLFNYNEKSNIISFIQDEIISLPIISNQIIYLIQPIKSYSINENINYAISDININIKLMIKYFDKSSEKEIIEQINSIKEYDKILKKGNCEQTLCYYLNKKTNDNQKYLLVKVDLQLSNLNNNIKNNIFTIQKNYIPIEIKSSIFFEMEKYSKKLFKFNYDSILINQTIIIYSNNENSIYVKNNKYGFISGKKLYVINKDMVYNDIIFELFNNNEDYKVNIEYIPKDKILYYKNSENRNKISNYRIKINECHKENYYYSAFNKKNDEIIYVEVVYGDSKVYSIENTKFSSINDLYNFNKIDNELSYPKIITSEYDIIQFVCTQPSLINIYYYNYQIEEIILNYGDSYGIYIKNGIKRIKIKKESEIYNNSFSFEIKLIYSNKKSKNARIKFNKKIYQLENKNNIIRDTNEKLIEEEIELESYNENTFILLKIGLKDKLYTYIKEEKKEIIPDKNYTIVLFPKNNEKEKYISSTIIIENNKPFNSGKICLSEGFNGEKYIEIPQNKDCISLNKDEKISFKTPYPYKDKISLRRLSNDYDNYFYTKIYFENPQNLKISYSFEKIKEKGKKENNNNNQNNNKTLIFIIIVVLIIIIIAVILYFLCKKKIISMNKNKFNFNKNSNIDENKKEMEIPNDLVINEIDNYPYYPSS